MVLAYFSYCYTSSASTIEYSLTWSLASVAVVGVKVRIFTVYAVATSTI